MSELKRVMMERDGLSSSEVDEMIAEARERILEGENPEDILLDDFGLEMDYIMDLI